MAIVLGLDTILLVALVVILTIVGDSAHRLWRRDAYRRWRNWRRWVRPRGSREALVGRAKAMVEGEGKWEASEEGTGIETLVGRK